LTGDCPEQCGASRGKYSIITVTTTTTRVSTVTTITATTYAATAATAADAAKSDALLCVIGDCPEQRGAPRGEYNSITIITATTTTAAAAAAATWIDPMTTTTATTYAAVAKIDTFLCVTGEYPEQRCAPRD